MNRLQGRIAVVSGGSSGMGRATAKQLVAEVATVIITGRRQDKLDEAVGEIGGAIEGFQSDIANLADLERLREYIATRHGHIDVIFAKAGGGMLGAFGTVSEADFDHSVTTNLKGTFFTVCCQTGSSTKSKDTLCSRAGRARRRPRAPSSII